MTQARKDALKRARRNQIQCARVVADQTKVELIFEPIASIRSCVMSGEQEFTLGSNGVAHRPITIPAYAIKMPSLYRDQLDSSREGALG